MIAPKIDETGDLDFDREAGTFSMIEGDDEVEQSLYLLLGTNIGELSWNESLGLNHMDVFINADDQSIVQTIITEYLRDQLGDSFETFEITSFKADKLNRLTSLSGTVTIDGESYKERMAIEQSDVDGEGDDGDAS
ncbi:hypothetical protein [Levilactobacillus wangkuiensis]|uniref:hypothetical protein n=1 Tax=Levilactobacillus wangkuiensis TaxID=2799566 RepID=UPI00195199D2|nr:hypothetical protein [Levilactobacillus wangkuiensis]